MSDTDATRMPLGSNAIAKLIVKDACANGNAFTDLELERSTPFRNRPETLLAPQEDNKFFEIVTPETLPAESMHLHLSLGSELAFSPFGRVYDVKVDGGRSSPDLMNVAIPPLILKVSPPNKTYKNAREAFYYEKMPELQGVVIPRYYGVFHATIPSGFRFRFWTPEKIIGGPSDGDSDYEDHFAIPRVITILVLERVGPKYLPLGRSLHQDEQEELSAMLSDIARHRICHGDIRYTNILSAPARSPEFPRLRSPYTKRKYHWRIVDFGEAYESTMSKDRFAKHIERALRDLFTELRERRMMRSMNLSRGEKA
ncbi:unnamed protein product [Somion occarium]|uniref:Protein kinase domain-containing protein n=1 Tax=Somion occarium TaxID=3059160 RepID=A0ABP1E112_9APHY